MDKLMLLISILLITHFNLLKDDTTASYAQPEPFEPRTDFYGLIAEGPAIHSSLIHAGDQWSANSFTERPWNSRKYQEQCYEEEPECSSEFNGV